MLKIILDTNLFKTDLKGLENYSFSSLYETLIHYVISGKIEDVSLCMTETSLKEFVKQLAEQYQNDVVDAYNKAYNIMKDSMPVLKLEFRNKYDFMEEYLVGIIDRLDKLNIELINTLPIKQEGGMKMEDVLDKTIKDIAPFDKIHNHNLKDAFISETINSNAKDNDEHEFLFITCNAKDFKHNTDISKNYQIEFIENNNKDKILSIFRILDKHGAHVDDETFYNEFLYSNRVRNDIKEFLEINIIEGQFYKEVPEIKKRDENHYLLKYEITEDHNIEIKFIIIDGENEHDAGVVYDLSKDTFPIINKYIFCIDDSNEEVYYDEF